MERVLGIGGLFFRAKDPDPEAPAGFSRHERKDIEELRLLAAEDQGRFDLVLVETVEVLALVEDRGGELVEPVEGFLRPSAPSRRTGILADWATSTAVPRASRRLPRPEPERGSAAHRCRRAAELSSIQLHTGPPAGVSPLLAFVRDVIRPAGLGRWAVVGGDGVAQGL